ncbi:uracil-DNA glycosylase family protein [Oceanospirillum sediminis]|uniref:Uracil-DNA glycosylase family protein n=1 Tax=Oceanospirillum sediminis TaxID=2760088 RepID=A0A839IRM6_9GAMM|nr:uracil-DNA glycosylase family protein [Oceanospirillum sediminis]MBB1488133.1 uracil-DNA glycosylase family protein [Oceanospirillum sediminis]
MSDQIRVEEGEDNTLDQLFSEIRQCRYCEPGLPLGANPVIRGKSSARVLIIGQAPGTRVHESSIPWHDASGKRLRQWLGLSDDVFYDEGRIAIMPMGLCYPGKGRSGDLPPRPECAPRWHHAVLEQLPDIQLTLLVGQYAQQYYLPDKPKTLTQTVQEWSRWLPEYLPLPHPSPRNTLWLRKNPWFEQDVIPELQRNIRLLLPDVIRE